MEAQDILNMIIAILGIAGTIGGVVTRISVKNSNQIAENITKALTPISYEIRTLNSHLDNNKVEHKEFKVQLEEHEDCLHDHDKRITVLEKGGPK